MSSLAHSTRLMHLHSQVPPLHWRAEQSGRGSPTHLFPIAQQLNEYLKLRVETPLPVTLDLAVTFAAASNNYESQSQKPLNKEGFLKHRGFLLVYRLA
jgi:hypothetical protein